MELNKTSRWPFIITTFWPLTLFGLGGWWIYLVLKLSNLIQGHQETLPYNATKLATMIKWEGLTFFVILGIFSLSLLYFYLADQKKTKAIGAFFSSLTHELKTPLASIRLQADTLQEYFNEGVPHHKLTPLIQRLNQSVAQLESELDKSLQLSRIERKAELPLHEIDLQSAWKKAWKKFEGQRTIHIRQELASPHILGEELAIQTIFRNLIENTLRHQADGKEIHLHIFEDPKGIHFIYDDHGTPFQGNVDLLGTLFYKHDSRKGTGIGLYLIKQLSQSMKAKFTIHQNPHLSFEFVFVSAKGKNI